MAGQKLCALSVDLDPLTAYYTIHGLGDPPRQVRTTILRKALPRFEEMFAETGIPATLFVVGRDLEKCDEALPVLRRLVEAGCEIGNHTYTHPYDLNRLPEQVIDGQVRWAEDKVVEVLGENARPVGFRAPGYGINAKVLNVLANRGYRYDSSMFPSPPYYGAKLAYMAGLVMRGRTSGAVVSDPRFLLCPADPYRPCANAPWKRGQAPLVELPVAVMPYSRLPAIGTMLAVAPEPVRRFVLRSMAGRPFFNLELHGIDLSDAVEDRIPTELAGRQPDLRVPFSEKHRLFVEAITALKRDYRFVTLREAAATVHRKGAVDR